MKYLVTGANGQLAGEFRKVLVPEGHEFTALGREELDIADMAAVRKALSEARPSAVLNCAAYNLVDKAEQDFESAVRVNATAVGNLASACSEQNILLVHYSTDYVFDGAKEDLYTEEDRTNPLNLYGRSKLQGEELLRRHTNDFLLFRVSWVFGGERQNFLLKLRQWSMTNRVLRIVSDQVSVPTSVQDIVHYTLTSISKGLRGVYHLTNSGYASRYEFAHYFLEQAGLHNIALPVDSGFFKEPAKRPQFSAMSNAKLSAAMGSAIPHWREAVDRYVRKGI